MKKISLFILGASMGCVMLNNTTIAQSSASVLRFGFYTKDLGKSSIKETDESFKRWVETIKSNTKVNVLSSAIMKNNFYDSKESLVEDIKKNKLDFMNISTFNFFDLDLQGTIIPMLTTSKVKESKFERYFLVAHKNSPVEDITNLNNARVFIPNSFSFQLQKIWLQVELKNKLKPADYAKIEIAETNKKGNEALFAIFFKKMDYAVVREDIYLLACELNAQIKRQTKVIATSNKFINNFFARRKDVDPEIYKEIVKIGMNLDKTVEGKQILNLMQMNSIHEISIADLQETESLIKQYKKIFGK